MITFNRCDVQLNNRMILLLISLALHSLPTCPSLRDRPTVCEHVTYVLSLTALHTSCSPAWALVASVGDTLTCPVLREKPIHLSEYLHPQGNWSTLPAHLPNS